MRLACRQQVIPMWGERARRASAGAKRMPSDSGSRNAGEGEKRNNATALPVSRGREQVTLRRGAPTPTWDA